MHPSKALFWKSEKSLIISDLNTNVMGKNGIWSDVKRKSIEDNFHQLYELINRYDPQNIYFLGKLFNIDDQYEWVRMNILMERFRDIDFHLINSKKPDDIMMGRFNRIRVHDVIAKQGILISYRPLKNLEGHCNICGYLNPGTRIKRRRVFRSRYSCFLVSENRFVLPSFNKIPIVNCYEPGNGFNLYCIRGKKIKRLKK